MVALELRQRLFYRRRPFSVMPFKQGVNIRAKPG